MNKTDRDWYIDVGVKVVLLQTYLEMYEIRKNYNICHNESNAFAALEQWLVNKMKRFGIQAEDIKELTEGTYD